MKTLIKLTALSILSVFLFSSTAFTQESPRETTSGKVAGSEIRIAYGSPSVRGRKIWDGLVPYGQLWRTGANQVTEFETSKDIKIEGQLLHAGKYSVFTVPGGDEWKVIFNSETGQWGIRNDETVNDDPAKDVLAVSVKPLK